MSESSETIADIIAEMRKPHDEICAKCHDKPNESCPYCGDPNGCNSPEYGQWPGVMTQLADRLEAAYKREIDEAERRANHAAMKNVSETLAKVGPLYDAESIGNAAKLREALVQVQKKIKYLIGNLTVPNSIVASRMEINGIINAALAAPPRNCDVGTPDEQAKRLDAFCDSHGHGFDGQKCYSCENCKLIFIDRCELAWAQMPYEEGGAK